MHLLADLPDASTIGIILAASAGLIGALVAVVKLPSDKNQSAVIQAQSAMETMEGLNEALIKERDYWKARFEKCHAEKAELLARQLQGRDGDVAPQ